MKLKGESVYEGDHEVKGTSIESEASFNSQSSIS